MIVNIYIQGSKLDLFQDENMRLIVQVADIEDITKNTTDYTKLLQYQHLKKIIKSLSIGMISV